LFFIPAVIVIERFGMRISLIISLALSITGSWIALMVNPMGVKILGQLIIDVGFPFWLCCIIKVSATWFPMRERFYATSFSFLLGLGGFAFGDGSISIFNNNPLSFAIFLTVIIAVAAALIVFLFKENPDAPPSMS
jgi:hypothetical protein